MSVTKKHMEWAAKYVWAQSERYGSIDDALLEGFISFFESFNPRFDEVRFRKACGAVESLD